MIEAIKNIDTQLFLWFNSHHNDFFDLVMYWVSAKYTWIPFYLLLFFLVYSQLKKRTWLIVLAVALLITLADQVSVHLFKEVFKRYRPCHNSAIQHMIHLVDGCGGKYGFVSSHAANTFAIATFLSLLLRNVSVYFMPGMFLWASFVSYSRIYNGVHYPMDIAFGALLGGALGFIVFKLFVYADKKIFRQTI